MTNGDKLRALSNEELAEFFGCNTCPPGTEDKCKSGIDCTTCWANWLNAEEEEVKMKCPACDRDLIKLTTAEEAVCPKCSRVYVEEELKTILEAEKIEEDMRIWLEARNHK